MKKLYRKGTVHPSPPTISDHLSFLPATLLTLSIALSPQDKEVLAYLISCSSFGNSCRTPKGVVDGDHPPLFNCTCFRCYMSYWVRWNSSPNHQLIHEIIDDFEHSVPPTTKGNKNRKERRNKRTSNNKPSDLNLSEFVASPPRDSESTGESSNHGGGDLQAGEGGGGVQDEDKGSVRRFVSFIGERIWGGWGL